jgi:hypothetical protein
MVYLCLEFHVLACRGNNHMHGHHVTVDIVLWQNSPSSFEALRYLQVAIKYWDLGSFRQSPSLDNFLGKCEETHSQSMIFVATSPASERK